MNPVWVRPGTDLSGFSVARSPEAVEVTVNALTFVFRRAGRSLGPLVLVRCDYAFGFVLPNGSRAYPPQVTEYERRLCPLKLVGLVTARAVAAQAVGS